MSGTMGIDFRYFRHRFINDITNIRELTRNSSRETFAVVHQPLSQLVSPDIWWPYQNYRSFVIRSRIVQRDFLVSKYLLAVVIYRNVNV